MNFDTILEEANNMSQSYEKTKNMCMLTDKSKVEGGYIQFALPLMWSHVEYSRALLVRAKDWWSVE